MDLVARLKSPASSEVFPRLGELLCSSASVRGEHKIEPRLETVGFAREPLQHARLICQVSTRSTQIFESSCEILARAQLGSLETSSREEPLENRRSIAPLRAAALAYIQVNVWISRAGNWPG